MKKSVLFIILLGLVFFSCNRKENKGNNKLVLNAPTFKEGSAKDQDGNSFKTVTYKTKKGDATWMAENLSVTKYKNGEAIFVAQNINEWIKACNSKIPACCYWHFDAKNKSRGLYYNFYAVSDKRGLAPEGWHVTSNNDWIELWDDVVPKSDGYDDGSFGPVGFDNSNSTYCSDNNWATFIDYKDRNWDSGELWEKDQFNKAKLGLNINGFVEPEEALHQFSIKTKGMEKYIKSLFRGDNDGTVQVEGNSGEFENGGQTSAGGYYWTSDAMKDSRWKGDSRAIVIEQAKLISMCLNKHKALNVRCVKNK
jgi:uncharacterized protein (TIGR02145 family)